jgi:hypothetical protein
MNPSHPTPLILPLSLSTVRGWKRPEKIIEEIKPRKTSNEDSDQGGDHSSTFSSPSCLVCQQHEARYTCPQCQIPYCSIECYRNHNNHYNDNDKKSSCTEEFYKKKVTSLMQLECLDRQDLNHRMLNRYHQQEHHSNHLVALDESEDYAADYLEEEDLYQLWSKLEELGYEINYMSAAEITNMIPSSLKTKFQKDLQQGKLQRLVLDHWFPWWRRQLVGNNEDSDVTEKATLQLEQGGSSERDLSLDERLLKTPKFDAMFKSNKRYPTTSNQELLCFNLIEILFATCCTLRLFHGVKNASTNAPVDASMTLVAASVVLGKDTRFTSLAEVLTHCKRVSKSFGRINGENEDLGITDGHWDVLLEDVALLVTSHRLVGRALLEAADLLKSAIKELKHCKSTSADESTKEGKDHSDVDNYQDMHLNCTKLRLLRKKLQFYLSWTQCAENRILFEEGMLEDEIITWIDEWKMIGRGQEDMEKSCVEMGSLRLSIHS